MMLLHRPYATTAVATAAAIVPLMFCLFYAHTPALLIHMFIEKEYLIARGFMVHFSEYYDDDF